MTQTENTLVQILIEARALNMLPNLDPAIKGAVDRINVLAGEALNGSIRKVRTPRTPKVSKEGLATAK